MTCEPRSGGARFGIALFVVGLAGCGEGVVESSGRPDHGDPLGNGGLLPRADLNGSYKAPQPIDPFGLADHGIDPGIGTMLLQGVAETR